MALVLDYYTPVVNSLQGMLSTRAVFTKGESAPDLQISLPYIKKSLADSFLKTGIIYNFIQTIYG